MAAAGPSIPTNIEEAMHTLTLTPPDGTWYMDTGATSHMTSRQGNLSFYFNLSNTRVILVMLTQPYPPTTRLYLKKMCFMLPNRFKICACLFENLNDNYGSVEFDSFGFSLRTFKHGCVS